MKARPESYIVNRESQFILRSTAKDEMATSEIVAVLFVAFFSSISWGIGSPVGSGTVPPSSVRSGLVRSPNPIDSGGNLVVTGNVVGGKHFRGIVPYRAASDFEGVTALSSIDSFLRRSAGTGNISSYIGGYKPYYSPTGTVARMWAGRRGVFRLATTGIGGRVPSPDTTRILPSLPEEKSLSSRYLALPNITLRPMAATPEELQEVISKELSTYSKAKKLADEQHQAWMEPRDSSLVTRVTSDERRATYTKTNGEDFESAIGGRAETVPSTKREGSVVFGAGPQLEIIGGVPREAGALDVYEQMKQQVDELKIILEYQKSQDVDTEMAPILQDVAKWEPKKGQVEAEGEKQMPHQLSPSGPDLDGLGSRLIGAADELSDVELSIRAKAILGEYKSFASFSESKFNWYMRVAEDYLKQGKYYRAADAYTLASIYKPADALAYAGKSHALFAAGEYMSSALFLSRALEIFPEYARFKIDLVAMIGDRDKLEARCADVEQWLKISDSAELHFLLGYVYYQMGRLDRAKEAIEAAYKKMPDALAINTLKRAIEDSI